MGQRKDKRGRNLRPGESQLADGRYRFRYTTPDGKRHDVYSWRLERGDRLPAGRPDGQSLRQLEKEVAKDTEDGIKRNRQTLGGMIELLFEIKGDDWKKSTTMRYRNLYNVNIRDSIGKVPLSKIDYSTLLTYYKGLLSDGLSVSSVQLVNTLISSALKLAVKNKLIRSNPAADGALADIGAKRGAPRRAVPEEELDAFLEYVARTDANSPYTNFTTFLLGTGCRLGEGAAVTWADIDFDSHEVNIEKQLSFAHTADNAKQHYFIEKPKTATSIRKVPLLPEVKTAILNERKRQMVLGVHSPTVDGVKDFVFLNERGNPMHDSGLNRWIKRKCEAYNRTEEGHIEPFTAHQLRHSFATRFCETESNLKVIADIMGHANIATTSQIYAEVTAKRRQQSFDNMRIFKQA